MFVLLAIVLLGCNGEVESIGEEISSTALSTDYGGWSRTTAIEELYQSAKSEGGVVYYASNQQSALAYKLAFEKEFPGIEVDVRGFLTESLSSTYLAERANSRKSADVLGGSLMALHPIVERDLIQTGIDWTQIGVEGGRVTLEGKALMVRRGSYCICFNQSKIDEQEIPTTLDGFRDPKWKDRLVASDFLFPAGLGYYALQNGLDNAVDLGRYLIDHQGLLVTSQYQSLVVSGERPVAVLGWAPSFINEERRGNPMGITHADGLGVPLFVVAVSDRAPHPHAAKLFAAFLTSKQASLASWESDAASGWPGYGHGLGDLDLGGQDQIGVVYEGPLNFRERSTSAGQIREALFR